VVLSKRGRYCSNFLSKHVDLDVSKIRVYQIRDLMILYIVALIGERVSSSYGLKKP
jgi:hypothetical protein